VHTVSGSASPAQLPEAGLDVIFARLAPSGPSLELTARIQQYASLLRPGGRLVLVDLQAASPAGELAAGLRQAGLANRLLFDAAGQPARTTGQMVALAVGTRLVPDVHTAVQQGYGARAEGRVQAIDAADPETSTGDGCCTGSGCDCTNPGVVISPLDIGYTALQLLDAPPEAAEIALGCGNPTAFAGLVTGEVVLDIGSGGGLDSLIAARAVGPSGHVIGVDMTPAMLARARQAAEKAGVTWAEYRQGQAEALPVENGSIDVALSNCVINLAPDKGLVFDEIYRVLRPGGRLEISDMVTDGALPAAVSADAQQWAGCVAGALPESEYVGLIAQAGFEDIRLQRSPAGEAYAGVMTYSLAVSARKPQLQN
jgi:SAM-dependent methyltransferase